MAIAGAAEIARAYLSVQVDDRKLGPGLNAVKKQVVDNAGQMAQLASQALAGLGLAATGVGVLKAAANYETAATAMEVMLGSAEKAKAMLTDLNKFSLETPFTPTQVNNAAQKLLAFGFAGEEVIGTLKTLGEVSSATGKPLDQLAVIYGQIRGAGRLMGQDLLQLINAGFNPLQEMSKNTGKSMSQLKKDMEAGNISFEMVEEAFRSATGAGGQFFQMMVKQSKTFNGLMSTVTGMVQEIARSIGMQLLPVAKEIIGLGIGIANAFVAADAATGGFLAQVTMTTGGLLGMTQAIMGVNTALKVLGITWMGLGKILLAGTGIGLIAIALGAAVVSVQRLIDWLVNVETVQNSLSTATDEFAEAWEHLKATAEVVGRALWGVLDSVAQVVFGQILPSFDQLGETIVSAFARAIDYVSFFALEGAKWIRVLVENWGTTWSLMSNIVEMRALEFVDFFFSAFQKIKLAATSFADSMAEIFGVIGKAITLQIDPMDAAKQIFEAGNKFRGALGKILLEKLPENPRLKQLRAEIAANSQTLVDAKRDLDESYRSRAKKPTEEEKKQGQQKQIPTVEKSGLDSGFYAFDAISKKLQETMIKGKDDTSEQQLGELKKIGKTGEGQQKTLTDIQRLIQSNRLPVAN